MMDRTPPADRLDLCRKILSAVLAAALLFVALPAADALFRSRDTEIAALAAALGTTRLALAPSGHPLRDPILLDNRVDLRFTPTLPRSLSSPFLPMRVKPLPPAPSPKRRGGVAFQRLSPPFPPREGGPGGLG
jgi:hypothetical protein